MTRDTYRNLKLAGVVRYATELAFRTANDCGESGEPLDWDYEVRAKHLCPNTWLDIHEDNFPENAFIDCG